MTKETKSAIQKLKASSLSLSELLREWLGLEELPNNLKISWSVKRRDKECPQIDYSIQNGTLTEIPHYPKQKLIVEGLR